MSIKRNPFRKTIRPNLTVRMGSDKGPASLGTNANKLLVRPTDVSERDNRTPDTDRHKGEGTCR